MKRKEEINKAAMKYLQRTTHNIQMRSTIFKTFKAGVKWADENVSWDVVVEIWNLATTTAIAQVTKEMSDFKSQKEVTEYIKQKLGL